MIKKITATTVLALALLVCLVPKVEAEPMGTAITYQGRLMDKNKPADGLYDFQFRLYDSNDPCTGNQLANPIDINNLDVIDGHFIVELDFGSGIFDGNAVWLETRVVRSPMGSDPATLSPLLELTPTPYALYAQTAGAGHSLDAADGSPTNAVYVDDEGHVGIGTTNPTAPLHIFTPGNYIAHAQTTSVYDYIFNVVPGNNKYFVLNNNGIGGGIALSIGNSKKLVVSNEGNVGIGTTSPSAKLDVNGDINISYAYKIGGSNILSITDTNNTHVGVSAGENNTADHGTFVGYKAGYNNQNNYNTFIGDMAGYSNATGTYNTFLGYAAGRSNTTGYANTFSGHLAGYSNTTGFYNTFLGRYTGLSNTTGSWNTFIGINAGASNTTGGTNIFLGTGTGSSNTTGYHNTFLGCAAGQRNTTGSYNTSLGHWAGYSNTTGSGNVFIGYRAGYNETGSGKLYIANGLADANTLIYGDFSTGNVGIGTTKPESELDVEGTIRASGAIIAGSLHIQNVPHAITSGRGEICFGSSPPLVFDSVKVGIGTTGPEAGLHLKGAGFPNSFMFLHSDADEDTGFRLIEGADVKWHLYNDSDLDGLSLRNNTATVLFAQQSTGNVGIGTTSPRGKLDVNGSIYQRGSVLHADYVFEPGYELESIDEHSEFMWRNRHLAAIPNAKVDENGREILEVGAHRRGIVEELEKAHIYIEQLHKRIKEMEVKLMKLEEVLGAVK